MDFLASASRSASDPNGHPSNGALPPHRRERFAARAASTPSLRARRRGGARGSQLAVFAGPTRAALKRNDAGLQHCVPCRRSAASSSMPHQGKATATVGTVAANERVVCNSRRRPPSETAIESALAWGVASACRQLADVQISLPRENHPHHGGSFTARRRFSACTP